MVGVAAELPGDADAELSSEKTENTLRYGAVAAGSSCGFLNGFRSGGPSRNQEEDDGRALAGRDDLGGATTFASPSSLNTAIAPFVRLPSSSSFPPVFASEAPRTLFLFEASDAVEAGFSAWAMDLEASAFLAVLRGSADGLASAFLVVREADCFVGDVVDSFCRSLLALADVVRC
jgi:hypothetical protein